MSYKISERASQINAVIASLPPPDINVLPDITPKMLPIDIEKRDLSRAVFHRNQPQTHGGPGPGHKAE